MIGDMNLLNTKLDALLARMDSQAQEITRLQELNANLQPLRNIAEGIQQQGEASCDASEASLVFLTKRVYQKSAMLVKTLDRLEALMDLVDEVEFLGKQVFTQAIDLMESYEKAGYFALAEESGKVVTDSLNHITTEDVRSVGKLVPSIIEAVKTTPEDKDATLGALIKKMFDPKVRKGLIRMLNVLKVLG